MHFITVYRIVSRKEYHNQYVTKKYIRNIKVDLH